MPPPAGSYQKDDLIEYLSGTHKVWLNAKVINVDGKGSIIISLKPNTWVHLDEQRSKIRPRIDGDVMRERAVEARPPPQQAPIKQSVPVPPAPSVPADAEAAATRTMTAPQDVANTLRGAPLTDTPTIRRRGPVNALPAAAVVPGKDTEALPEKDTDPVKGSRRRGPVNALPEKGTDLVKDSGKDARARSRSFPRSQQIGPCKTETGISRDRVASRKDGENAPTDDGRAPPVADDLQKTAGGAKSWRGANSATAVPADIRRSEAASAVSSTPEASNVTLPSRSVVKRSGRGAADATLSEVKAELLAEAADGEGLVVSPGTPAPKSKPPSQKGRRTDSAAEAADSMPRSAGAPTSFAPEVHKVEPVKANASVRNTQAVPAVSTVPKAAMPTATVAKVEPPPDDAPAAQKIVNVRLTLGGRSKAVRHAATTSLSHLLKHYEQQRNCQLVAKDASGFEIGLEVTLGQLATNDKGVLELLLEEDNW